MRSRACPPRPDRVEVEPAGRRGLAHELLERAPCEVLHRDARAPVAREERVEQPRDELRAGVRGVEPPQVVDLAAELQVRAVAALEHLDGDAPRRAAVLFAALAVAGDHVAREVHAPGHARAERREQVVAVVQNRPGRERRRTARAARGHGLTGVENPIYVFF